METARQRSRIVWALVGVAMLAVALAPVATAAPITPASYAYSTPPDAHTAYYLDDTGSQLTDGVKVAPGSQPVPGDASVGWLPSTSTEITFDLGGTYHLTGVSIGHTGKASWSKFAPDDVTVTFSTDGTTSGPPVSSSAFTDFTGTTSYARDDLALTTHRTASHVKVAFDGGVRYSSGSPNGYLLDEITFDGVPSSGSIAVVNAAGAAVPDTGSSPPHDLENNPYVMSFDAGATADKLIVQLSGETSPGAIGVTYNGVPLTLAPGTVADRNKGIYYLDNPYTGGPADLIVDMTAKSTVNGIGLGVVSIAGSAPGVDATAIASANGVTITPTLDGSFVMAGFGAQGHWGDGAADAPLTELYGGNIGSAEGAAGYQLDVPAGANVVSFLGGSAPTNASAAAFAPAEIPEPASALLVLVGLGALARYRRRRALNA